MPTLQYAGVPAGSDAYQHEGVSGGDSETTPAGHGSAISTCPAPAVYGAWGRVGEGRLLSQDDDDIQAVRSQLCKARGTWARVGQVLRKENAPPRVSAKFYKAIVQSILLYGRETWVLSTASLARLKGFHLRAACRMAKKHVPRRGPHQQWVYPPSDKVLEECGMHTI